MRNILTTAFRALSKKAAQASKFLSKEPKQPPTTDQISLEVDDMVENQGFIGYLPFSKE